MSFFVHDSDDVEETNIVKEEEKKEENFSTQLDGYWDKNNAFVKLLLGVLGIITVIGVVYYEMAYMGSR